MCFDSGQERGVGVCEGCNGGAAVDFLSTVKFIPHSWEGGRSPYKTRLALTIIPRKEMTAV